MFTDEQGWLDEPVVEQPTKVCTKCRRSLYYDTVNTQPSGGGSRYPLRDEVHESTLCPLGGLHEIERRP